MDFAKCIDGEMVDGQMIDIEINEADQTYKHHVTSKTERYRSVENLLFSSSLLNSFPNVYIECFSSDYYRKRCRAAHGEEHSQFSEFDIKMLMLFFISTCHAIFECLQTIQVERSGG